MRFSFLFIFLVFTAGAQDRVPPSASFSLRWVTGAANGKEDMKAAENFIDQINTCIRRVPIVNRVPVDERAPVFSKDEKEGSPRSFESGLADLFNKGAAENQAEFFIDIQSHGCSEGLQRLSEDQRRLDVYPYEDLAKLIYNSAHQHAPNAQSVNIFVSACHSGAFIPKLKERVSTQPTTFRVWTSADSESVSFGTDFYEAVLKIGQMNRSIQTLTLPGQKDHFCPSDAGTFCSLSEVPKQFWSSKESENPTKSLSLAELTTILDSLDEFPRLQATYALARLGPEAKPVLGKLVTILKDSANKVEMRVGVTRVIEQIGPSEPSTLKVLAELATDERADPWLREMLVFVLRKTGAQGIPSLLKIIQQTKGRTEPEFVILRRQALKSIHVIGKDAAPATEALIGILGETGKDGHDDGNLMILKNLIVQTLGRIGPPAKGAVPVLYKILSEYDGLDAKIFSGRAIGQIDPTQASRLAELASPKNKDFDARLGAVLGLAELPVASPAVLEALDLALDEDNGWIVSVAADGLAKAGASARLSLEKLKRLQKEASKKFGDDVKKQVDLSIEKIEK